MDSKEREEEIIRMSLTSTLDTKSKNEDQLKQSPKKGLYDPERYKSGTHKEEPVLVLTRNQVERIVYLSRMMDDWWNMSFDYTTDQIIEMVKKEL